MGCIPWRKSIGLQQVTNVCRWRDKHVMNTEVIKRGRHRETMRAFGSAGSSVVPILPYIYMFRTGISLTFLQRNLWRAWLTPQPDSNKCDPSTNRYPDTCNPNPAATDEPAARVLIVCKVTHSHLFLHLDVGQEWPLVVYSEGEDTMLIGCSECSAVDGAIFGVRRCLQWQSVKRRKH